MVQRASLSAALQALPTGSHIYLPGGAGEPAGVVQALQQHWPAGKDLAITTTFLPGINALDFQQLDPAITVSGLFLPPRYAGAAREGRYRHMPISYATLGTWLDTQAQFDAVLVQVAPPDASGRYSLGPAVEFTMQAIARSRRVIAVVNPNMPRLVHAPSLSAEMISTLCEAGDRLVTYDIAPDELGRRVAAQAASLIEDGAVLQMGIGKIPAALPEALRDRRNLRFWSGMISDGVMAMVESGALQARIGHTCMALGTTEFYEWLRDRDDIVFHGCDRSHNPRELLAIDGFVAVNGAIEVDLLGQCNSERVDGRALSGAGGAPDFAYAARRIATGKSVIALPSEAGERSRIVPLLGSDSMTTLPRTEVDYVVTEHGVADLRFASVPERAERLIEIAAPQHRPGLRDAWNEIVKRL